MTNLTRRRKAAKTGPLFAGRTAHRQIQNQPVRGFTLIELMVVIVIIALLLALLVPALGKARATATETKVISEIKGLESGIAAFKSKYGLEPPSQFVLYLTSAGWTSDPASRALVRRIWPQFDFTMGSGSGVTYPAFWDTIAVSVNGNKALTMNSGECLLFFLGGVIDTYDSTNSNYQNQAPVGFSKNPLYPFAPRSTTLNREGPFFNGFSDVSRVKDSDGNNINEWYDPIASQTSPYLYFSSYEGRGYVLNELPNTGKAYLYLSDIYRASSSVPNTSNGYLPPSSRTVDSNGNVVASGSQLLPAQNSQSCQIISPGFDGNFGQGGVFNSNLPNSGLTDSSGNPDTAAFDNLTNFNGGRLKP